jgi:hypothetical protein
MADYYPLIARAIAGLDPSAPGESRRALYERARAALIAQLRSVEPPLSESEITRERLSLEEAVRKVESEAAQRARDATRSSGDASRSGRAGDAFRANTRPTARPGDPAASPSAQPRSRPPSPPPPRSERPPLGGEDRPDRQEPRPQRILRDGPPPIPGASPPDAPLPPTRERVGAPRRGPDNSAPQAARGFRDITADADELGRAAAQANRAARKTYANVPSPSPEFDRLEPSMENRGDADSPYSYDESVEEAERYATPQQPAPRPRISQERGREPKKRGRSGAAFPFKSAIAIGVVFILVGAGILWGKSLVTAVSGMFKPSTTVVEAPKDGGTPLSKPKIPDRVGQPS